MTPTQLGESERSQTHVIGVNGGGKIAEGGEWVSDQELERTAKENPPNYRGKTSKEQVPNHPRQKKGSRAGKGEKFGRSYHHESQ